MDILSRVLDYGRRKLGRNAVDVKHHGDKIKMQIGLSLNFKESSLDGKFYIKMVDKYLHYKPEKFVCRKDVRDWNEKKYKEVIESLSSGKCFFLFHRMEHLRQVSSKPSKSRIKISVLHRNRDFSTPPIKRSKT